MVAAPDKFSADAEMAYQEALAIARAGDLVSWRKLVAAKKAEASEALLRWRKQVAHAFPQKADPEFIYIASETHQPLFAIALAGVESGQSKFNQQAGLIYDLMEPKGWERSGPSVIVQFPDTLTFVFHAMLGAMCVYSGQNSMALDLATQRIADRHDKRQSGPLFKVHALTAWPGALEQNCTLAWSFLIKMPDRFPWIAKVFGSTESFRAALCGYFVVLSWLDFLEHLGRNPEARDDVDIPPLFLRHPEHALGIRQLLEDRTPLRDYSSKLNLDLPQQIAAWDEWRAMNIKMLSRVFQYPFEHNRYPEWEHLVEDIHR